MPAPTLRSLARDLGLSRTTISDALRGSPRVKAETVERVRAAAKAAGYERNPLTGAVMSLLRRSRGQQFRGVLAALELVEAGRSAVEARYNECVMQGLTARANALGFKVERFEIGPHGVRLSRLDAILHTRGVQGIVILPATSLPDLSSLTWSRYTAVYADYSMERPPLHCVCPDHHRSVSVLLRELHARGYRRPGLFVDAALEERAQGRWEGAFVAAQKSIPGFSEVPVLRLARVTQPAFETWFRRNSPDVVLGHDAEAIAWMRNCGAKLPKTHGFVCLDSLRADANAAALDLQTAKLGARAAELVIGQLLQNDAGLPEQPSLTTIPARLIEGPTLRAAGGRRKPAPEAPVAS